MPADSLSHTDWSLSKVEDLTPPLRRVLLFGSFSQLLSYLACVAAVLLPVMLCVDAHVAGLLAIGALCGSLPAVLAAMPARVTVQVGTAPTVAAVEHHLDAVIRTMGYVPQRREGVRHYRLRLNWWARWQECDFEVLPLQDRVVVTGPRASLARLRDRTAVWLASH